MSHRPSREECELLDAADPLAFARARFLLPPNRLYLDGNSLGALPHATRSHMRAVVERQWGEDLIAGWNAHGWTDAPLRIGARIAPLIGAAPEEVLVADTASINVFKLAAGALSLRPGRRVIVTEAGNFPTDLYMLQGLRDLLGDVELRVVPADGVPASLDESVALLLLTHVHYKTGRRWDMQALTDRAHAVGALTLWDLSHSAGAIRVQLNACGADLAVGCGYKFFNGGPGAPGFLFVATRHLAAIRSPLTGWFGHADPFTFQDEFAPAEGVRRMLCSTPPVLGLAALESALSVWDGVDMAALEQKSGQLGDIFIRCLSPHPDLTLATPARAEERGAHVSLAFHHGYAAVQALIAQGVVGDFRAPDLMRFGFAPLTTRYVDAYEAAVSLNNVLAAGDYRDPRFQTRQTVT